MLVIYKLKIVHQFHKIISDVTTVILYSANSVCIKSKI